MEYVLLHTVDSLKDLVSDEVRVFIGVFFKRDNEAHWIDFTLVAFIVETKNSEILLYAQGDLLGISERYVAIRHIQM